MSKSIIEEVLSQEEVYKKMEQYFLQKAQNNLVFDKEKVHEEFSLLCRKSPKETIEMYAKNFQLTLDMNYEDGHFPIVAANHDNLDALQYFYENHRDVYNKYYTNLVNAAAFNQSTHCQEFLSSHSTESQDVVLSGHQEFHVDEY
ncbi:hypothetical protein Trichorick_01665 (plasmid) [Candidatus Trichorickettsia mobilis]|uniref:hypothetical protein n=1 Tax=Candidatus Trichorickettsia mobilis TaxID=1346319 RepID=UPI002B25A46A|nr:hypothetical protein [Candidatus Trichorickettsia mobilis]WPY01747.1 hypothetical protein Trichorick_01665 [Candidatus Trichorickettsia mobilis]